MLRNRRSRGSNSWTVPTTTPSTWRGAITIEASWQLDETVQS